MTPLAYLRDLDGSGSFHVCAKGDPGAIAVVAVSETERLVDLLDPLLRYHETGGHEGHCSEKLIDLIRLQSVKLKLAAS